MDKRPSILYVEDEITFHIIMENILEDEFDLDFANDGLEGFEKAVSKKYDIILMDINMPNMNGIESARLIKREIPNQFIIVTTAYYRGDFDDTYFDDYYQKPLNLKTFKKDLLNIFEWLQEKN